MASAFGRPHPSLKERLHSCPQAFELFQAIRLLERMAAQDHRRTGPSAIGLDAEPATEAVRLSSALGLTFHANEIESLEEGLSARLSTALFGMLPPAGILPGHYLETIAGTHRRKVAPLRDFLDMLVHRSLSFAYRTWAKHRLPVSFESHLGSSGDDPVTALLLALVGLRGGGTRNRLAVSDFLFLEYGAFFADRRRPAVVLETLVSRLLGAPAKVSQFRAVWLPLARHERTVLPAPDQPEGAFCQLGRGAILGARGLDAQGSYRIVAGPLAYDVFADLLPGMILGRELAQFVIMFAGAELEGEIQVVLRGDQVPRLHLDGDPLTGCLPLLGLNTWLGEVPCEREVRDAVFPLRRLAEKARRG